MTTSSKGKVRGKDSRPTIGLLSCWLRGGYGSILWTVIDEAAREQDVNLICFIGRHLRSPYEFEAKCSVIYDLAGIENVDGLIILGLLGIYLDV